MSTRQSQTEVATDVRIERYFRHRAEESPRRFLNMYCGYVPVEKDSDG